MRRACARPRASLKALRAGGKRQRLQHPLEEDPLPAVAPEAEGRADSLKYELRRAVERDGQAVALQEASRDDAREGVARPGIVRRHVRARHLPGSSVRGAAGDDGREVRSAPDGHARDDHRVRPEGGELADHPLELVLRAFGPPGAAEEREELREVGRQHVRAPAKRAHGGHHLLGDLAVEPSVVAEHGIDDDERARGSEAGDEVPDDLDLPGRAEVARVDRVEVDSEPLPLGDDARHLVGEVEKREARVLRVVRKDRRRKRADFAAHRRENGQDRRERDAADAREVVNRGDAAREAGSAHGREEV